MNGVGHGEAGDPMFTLQASAQHGIAVPHTLRANHDASEDGTGRGKPIIPVDVPERERALTTSTQRLDSETETFITMSFQPRIARNGRGNTGDVVNALQAQSGQTGKGDAASEVRRLTPEECEALQAFPRGYTKIPWRGKAASECPDGPRYAALGNSMATNVMRWIGKKIEQIIH